MRDAHRVYGGIHSDEINKTFHMTSVLEQMINGRVCNGGIEGGKAVVSQDGSSAN